MPELKPCPWPHRKPEIDEAVLPPEVDTGYPDWQKGFWVRCPWCYATGPFCSTAEAAAEAWNTRPSHPDTVRLEKLAAHGERHEHGRWWWFEVDCPVITGDPKADLRTALDALHGATEEV